VIKITCSLRSATVQKLCGETLFGFYPLGHSIFFLVRVRIVYAYTVMKFINQAFILKLLTGQY
jgi:hypothetical protein